jgi:sec-independent protein translocase protein TatB
MFGVDSPELLVIAVVALVVIGPKELPGLLRTWGKWMSQMRGMASEFRGHVDEMVRQSELDEVKKQLEGSAGGLDLKSLDPTKQIRQHIQEGMAEGDKAWADTKSTLDNPLAEPESAPQVGMSEPQIATELPPEPSSEPQFVAELPPEPAADAALAVTTEATPAATEPPTAAPVEPPVENKPAKAAAE